MLMTDFGMLLMKSHATKRTTLAKTKFCSSVASVEVLSWSCLAAAVFFQSRGGVWRLANMTFPGVRDQSLLFRFDLRRFFFCYSALATLC